MNFFTENDAAHVKNVVGVKNKWSWAWLSHEVDVQLKKHGKQRVKLETQVRKGVVCGKAWCVICDTDINYANRGRVALVNHVTCPSYLKKMDIIISNRNVKTMLKAMVLATLAE